MWGCYTANSVPILVNGSPTSEFTASRGLKKGDPLAPFLFIVAAEGLAGLVRKAEESNCFRGFSVNDNLSISMLQFADDTMIFCDGSEANLWSLKVVLRSFKLASGLKVNFAKSNVMGINIEDMGAPWCIIIPCLLFGQGSFHVPRYTDWIKPEEICHLGTSNQ